MSINEHPPQTIHTPVLLDKMLEVMKPSANESYLDLTAGYGGHAKAFLEATGAYSSSVLIDRDHNTVPYLEDLIQEGTEFRQQNFVAAAQQLVTEGRTFDLVAADLGVSSPQLDRAERGFSFSRGGPLDMRMDQSQEISAETIVNSYDEEKLISVIVRFGEEPKPVARRIARAIIDARPISTTDRLAQIIAATIRGRMNRSKRIHPATRTFQALRIEVNNELQQIEQLLPYLPKLLCKNGRVGIISFHSLEDRLVKRYFSEQMHSGYEAELEIMTKKPLSGADYDVHNPRSRSSKLRIAVKK